MDIGSLVYAFFDNAGPGGVFVLLVIGPACALYYFLTRWIVAGGKDQELGQTTPDDQTESMDA
jgi:hypothetical protein